MSRKSLWYLIVLILLEPPPLRARDEAAGKSLGGQVAASFRPAHALRISAGDLLDVNVFDTPELSAKLRVNENGEITLPIVGGLAISGMTADQAAQVIEVRLREAKILKEPHVSVMVLEYATQGVSVLGEVKNPGIYPLLGSHDLLDLISAAGGFTSAAGKSVTISHRADPNHAVTVRMENRLGSSVPFNIDVQPGDTIIVSHAGIVYVIGDVGKPGGFLIENNERLTIMRAIALAQGTNRTASLDHAKLIRQTEAGREEMPVAIKKIVQDKAPDQSLVDGDILFVPSSGKKNALRDLESILPSTAGAAVYRVP